MEKYSIRSDYNQFVTDLEHCKGLVLQFTSYKEQNFDAEFKILIVTQQHVLGLAGMCKDQSLFTIGRVNPFIALMACSNLIATIKNVYLENSNKAAIEPLLVKINNILDNLISNAGAKVSIVTIPDENEQREEQKPDNPVLNEEQAANLLNKFETVQYHNSANEEEAFYKRLTTQIQAEREQIALDLEDLSPNSFKFVKGSVSVNHAFRPNALKDIPHSVISFKGISYNRQRHEAITPVFVFHDQILAAIRVNPKRFVYRKTPLTAAQIEMRKQRLFEKLVIAAETDAYYREGPVVNLNARFAKPYLVSKVFQKVYFIWFISPVQKPMMEQVKEGTVALLWE